jgi:RNA-directed DNA polymerase
VTSQPAKETGAVRTTDNHWPTSLRAIAKKAQQQKRHRFGGLYRLLNEQSLRTCFYPLRKAAAPGVDGVTFKLYERDLEENLRKLVQRLRNKSYHARLVRRKYIPKGEGKWRPLGIPVLEDKLVQLAGAQILSAIYEADFLPCNQGYRPERGAQQAARELAEVLTKGRMEFVVEVDIRGYFDTVKFDRLMRLLARRITDPRVLRLIGAYLRAGVKLPEGSVETTTQGVPQGGPLSPLLANIMLDPLDKELERRGLRFARYADDFLILVKSLRAAQRVMQSVTRFVEVRLKLVVNRQKSRAAALSTCAFLGFQIRRGRVVWTEKARTRFKERIQAITSRSRGVSTYCMLSELRRYVVGWLNYFGISQAYREIPEMDQWLRRRVRMYYWKQWKRARNRRRQLVRLGIHPVEVYKATRSHRGYWWMAGTSPARRDAARARQSLADGTGSAQLKATVDRDALRQAERAIRSCCR